MTDQFYEGLFDTLEANFRSAVNPATRNAWAMRLASLDRRYLRAAVSNLCSTEEKMPSLAKILQAYRGASPSTGAPRFTPTRDSRKIACFWDSDAGEHLYRAPDCAEGRNFLAELGKLAGKTPEQMAKSFEKWCGEEAVAK
jgi:hypothetical protein